METLETKGIKSEVIKSERDWHFYICSNEKNFRSPETSVGSWTCGGQHTQSVGSFVYGHLFLNLPRCKEKGTL